MQTHVFVQLTRKKIADEQNNAEIQANVDMVVSSPAVIDDRTEHIRKETEADETMKTQKEIILQHTKLTVQQ